MLWIGLGLWLVLGIQSVRDSVRHSENIHRGYPLHPNLNFYHIHMGQGHPQRNQCNRTGMERMEATVLKTMTGAQLSTTFRALLRITNTNS